MRSVGDLDENKLWQLAFPHLWAYCGETGTGVYELPTAEELTERLKQAGEILMIKLTDHIIIGITREDGGYEHGFYSFCEHGLL